MMANLPNLLSSYWEAAYGAEIYNLDMSHHHLPIYHKTIILQIGQK